MLGIRQNKEPKTLVESLMGQVSVLIGSLVLLTANRG